MAIQTVKRGEKIQAADIHRWWNATEERVGTLMSAAAESIEYAGWRDRYMSFCCARAMTGRGVPGSFGCSIGENSSRMMQTTWGAVFNPPALNVIASSADVLLNRVYKSRPFVEFITNRGNWQARKEARTETEFVDVLFEDLKLWDVIEQCGQDCMTYPAAWVKVCEGFDGEVDAHRVLDEEILFMPDDNGGYGNPRSLLQRVFVNREDAMEYVTNNLPEEEQEAALAALKNTPGVRAGFYRAPIQYDDIIALVEGWRLPSPAGKPGRHVLAIGGIVLKDEKWTRKRFPFARLVYNTIGNSARGQSLAEVTLPLQREIDRISTTIAEMQRRNAYPRWGYKSGSGITPEMFMGPGFIVTNSEYPQQFLGLAVPAELYSSLDAHERRAYKRNGISEQQSGGATPGSLTSGRAIMAYNQVDDSRHVALAQRQEDFVTDIAKLVVEQAADSNVKAYVNGKMVPWRSITSGNKRTRPRAFPMSRLPTLPAAKLQQIENWYNEGTITRQTKMRLQDMPDVNGFIGLFTASENYVYKQLDKLVFDHDYEPPSPYSNLAQAIAIAQARYLQEAENDAPDESLMLVATYISALKEMIEDTDKVTAAAGPQPAAMQSPGGAPPIGPMATPDNLAPPPEAQPQLPPAQ